MAMRAEGWAKVLGHVVRHPPGSGNARLHGRLQGPRPLNARRDAAERDRLGAVADVSMLICVGRSPG